MEPGKLSISSFPENSEVWAGLGSTCTKLSSSSDLGQLWAGKGAEEEHRRKTGWGGSSGGKSGQSRRQLTDSLYPAKQVAVEA